MGWDGMEWTDGQTDRQTVVDRLRVRLRVFLIISIVVLKSSSAVFVPPSDLNDSEAYMHTTSSM